MHAHSQRRHTRRPDARARLRRHAWSAVASLCAAALLACGPGEVEPESPAQSRPAPPSSVSAPPNVLLVTVDTLRHDRLGFAGHHRNTSPSIDALASESVVFTRAYSQSGWTLPSMASVMTGQPPARHGATHFHERMDSTLPTLASTLKARGHATYGFVSHILLRPKHGFAGGFDRLDTSVLALGRPKFVESAEPITELALATLADVPEPFFVWVHYFDPHNEYLPHAAWSSFGDDASGLYDQEIAWTDAQIGRLLDALDTTGLADRTIVALTADHGEEFGEHGGVYHYTLHEEIVRIPLLLRVPGAAPRIDDTPVQQIDLLPTILAAVGAPADPSLPGRDLLASEIPPEPIFIERERPAGFHQRAMIQGQHKLVVIEVREPDPDAPPPPPTPTPLHHIETGVFFYDLERDPLERSPLDPAGHPMAAEMLAAMAKHFESLPAGTAEAVELTPETEAALRALGYLE